MGWYFLTLLVLTFLVYSGIGGGHNVPTDLETPVKPRFMQNKTKYTMDRGMYFLM